MNCKVCNSTENKISNGRTCNKCLYQQQKLKMMNDPKYREKILKGKRNYISRRRDEPEYILKEQEYLEKYIKNIQINLMNCQNFYKGD